MAQGTIRIEMELDGDKFTYQVKNAVSSLDRLGKKVDSADKSIKKIEGHITSLGQALKDFTLTVSLAHGAINNLWALTGGWMSGIVQTNAEIERMTYLLKGMSGAADETSKLKDARDNVQWMFDFAKSAPFSMQELTNSFVKFKSVGIDPTDGSLRSLIDAVAAFGGDDQILHRASVAIQQMAGKGVISMEELRQQLGEAVPEAIHLMARSMGMSYGQLVSQISKGTVEARNALDNMFAEFERVYGGRSQQMMTTFAGLAARLKTEWIELQKEIGDAGYFNAAKSALAELINVINQPMTASFAADLGAGLTSLVNGLRSTIEVAINWRDEIITAVKMAVGSFLLFKSHAAITGIASMFAEVGSVIVKTTGKIVGFNTAMASSMIPNFVTAIRTGQSFATAIQLDAAALAAFGRATWNLIPVIGSVIATLWTLIDVFDVFGKHSKEALDEAKKGIYALLDAKQYAEVKSHVTELSQGIADIDKRLELLGKNKNANTIGTAVNSQIIALKKQRELLDKELSGYSQAVEKYEGQQLQSDARLFADNQLSQFNEGAMKLKGEYNRRAIEIEKQFEGDAQKRQEELAKLRKDSFDQEIASYDKEMERLNAALEKAKPGTREQKGFELAIYQLTDQYATLLNSHRATASAMLKSVEAADKGKLTPVQTRILQLTENVAKLKAKMGGTGEEIAEVMTEISGGKYKGATEQQIALIKKLAIEQDTLKKSYKDASEEMKKQAQAMEAIDNAKVRSESRVRQLEQQIANPNEPETTKRQRNFKANMDAYVNVFKENTAERAEAARKAKEAITSYAREESLAYIDGLRDQTNSLRAAVLERKDALKMEYEYAKQKAEREAQLDNLTETQRIEASKRLHEYLAALENKYVRDSETPIESLTRKWKNSTEAMQEASAQWLDDFSNKLTDFAVTGKANFADFAESILRDILRIQTQSSLSSLFGKEGFFGKAISEFGGVAGKWLLGQTGTEGGGAGLSAGTTDLVSMFPTNHSGGIVGKEATFFKSISAGLFAGAPKFHGGGVVGTSRLSTDEVPIIAKKGEGVFTQEQMRALGKSGTQNIQVNVINQSGQPVGAEAKTRFDGEAMVLDIVLRAMNRPGSFRENMKTAVR